MRFPSVNELFWAGLAISWTIHALKAPNETVKAIYFLGMTVSLAVAFLLKAVRTKEK